MATTPFRVNEQTTARYTAQIVDETGAALPAASLSTLKLTVYDQASGSVLNSRSQQNVLNANGVTVDSSGNLVWVMDPADNAIVGTRELEAHIALFEWTWASTKAGRHEVPILVLNLAKVT
jgi:hypothetical protein